MPYGGSGGYGTGSTGRDSGGGSSNAQFNSFGQFGDFLMGKKKKSSSMPQVSSEMEKAQAQDWAAQQEFNRNQTLQRQKDEAAAAEKAAGIAKTQGQTADLYGQGQAYGKSQLGQLGIEDKYGLMNSYNQSLNAARSKAAGAAGGTDVGSYFDTADMWSQAVNNATNAQRGQLDTAYRNMTKPGWQNSYFADEADDAILNSILAEQQGGVANTLKQNLDRGQMSQGAYDYAKKQLGTQATGALSKLQGIGGGVLGGYRDKLGTIANQFGDQITGYKLGQNINTGDLTANLQNKQRSLTGGMQGDIINALGDTQLFDPDALIAKAGAAAGPSNTPLSAAFSNQPQAAVPEAQRTTGTTGIF